MLSDMKPTPRPDQRPILEAPERFLVINAGRRYGKDWMASYRLARQVDKYWGGRDLKWDGRRLYWIIAPTKDQAAICRNELLRLLPDGTFKTWRTTRKIMFRDNAPGTPFDENHCTVIDIKSAKDDRILRGPDLCGLVFSEFAHIMGNQDLWASLRPTLALPHASDPGVLGWGWFYSNPNKVGREYFATLADVAQDKQQRNWVYFHRTSLDNPNFDPQEIDDAQSEGMSNRDVRVEYFAEFLDEGWGALPPWSSVLIPDAEEWEPYDEHGYYVFGVDLARVKDYTAIVGLRIDVQPWRMVYYRRIQQMDWQGQVDEITQLLQRYGDAPCSVDQSGVGDPIYELLVKAGCRVYGVNMHSIQSRNALVERLIAEAEQKKFQIPERAEQVDQLRREWQAFGGQPTPSGRIRYAGVNNQNDDSVFALALAVDRAMGMGQPNVWVV